MSSQTWVVVALVCVLSGVVQAGPSLKNIDLAKTGFRQSQFYYGHGGWMGYGPQLIGDNRVWAPILKALLPREHAAILALYQKGDYAGVVKACENNPVAAALGFMSHNPSSPITSQPFEWDSFFPASATAQNPQVDSMLIAHGTPFILFHEGTLKRNQYESAKDLDMTKLGGSTAIQWRDNFVRAVRLAQAARKAGQKTVFVPPADIVGSSVTWQQFNALFPGGKFKVVLDIKTGIYKANPDFLKAVIDQFTQRGIKVVGVGSFSSDQIKGLSAKGVEETLFFHGLRGTMGKQLLETDPAILKGRSVLFNGGFLITYSRFTTGANKLASYAIAQKEIDDLRALKKKVGNVKIGIYVQEYDIDARALELILTAVGKNPDVFDKGFAWGGFPSAYYDRIKPSFTDATVGTNGQILFAKKP